jgi:uncharacterized protein (DUF1800 family)
MPTEENPWSAYQPTAADPWDLPKVAHLHRRAGFGAAWSELQRDLRAGPEASVRRLLEPAPAAADQTQILQGLRQGAIASGEMDRLKAWWLWRVLYSHDPIGERMTLFWHSHFATSQRKVLSLDLMLAQNETLRRHALGEFADLLNAIVIDPAMLIWLDGADSRRDRPNENFGREFLELFTLGTGNYREADVRQAARAFTGWSQIPPEPLAIRHTPRFRFDAADHDDGDKTFLGQTGRWNAGDIVRIVLAQPAAAEFLCRRLYRAFVRDEGEPTAELMRPLAAELRTHRYAIRHVLGIMLRSRHFFSTDVRYQRIKGPVEFSAGLLRALDPPRANVRMLSLAAACDRQGQELFHPPNVSGWVGGRTWLSSTTVIERGNWCNDVIWGNDALGIPPFDVVAWAQRNGILPAQAAASLIAFLLSDVLDEELRRQILRMASSGEPDALRRALQLIVHNPRFQLA